MIKIKRVIRKCFITQSFCQVTQEPSWMKFFKGFQSIEVNIDRSLKNSNTDLLFGYIKANYKSFNYTNLLTSLSKIENRNLISMIENEFILRTMLQDDQFINILPNQLELFVQILKNGKIQMNDLFVNLVAIKCQQNYDDLTLSQKIRITDFLFEQNMIENKNLDSIKQELEKSNLDELNLQDFKFILGLFEYSYLNNITINQSIIDKVCQKYFQILRNDKLLIKLLQQQDLAKHLLQQFPLHCLTDLQEETLKELYAKCLNEYLSENNFSLYKKSPDLVDALKILLNFFKRHEIFLISDAIYLMGNHLQKQSTTQEEDLFSQILIKYQLVHPTFLYNKFIKQEQPNFMSNLGITNKISELNNYLQVLNVLHFGQALTNNSYYEVTSHKFYLKELQKKSISNLFQKIDLDQILNKVEEYYENPLQVYDQESERNNSIHQLIMELAQEKQNDQFSNEDQREESGLNQNNEQMKDIYLKQYEKRTEKFKQMVEKFNYIRAQNYEYCSQQKYQNIQHTIELVEIVALEIIKKTPISNLITLTLPLWERHTLLTMLDRYQAFPRFIENLIIIYESMVYLDQQQMNERLVGKIAEIRQKINEQFKNHKKQELLERFQKDYDEIPRWQLQKNFFNDYEFTDNLFKYANIKNTEYLIQQYNEIKQNHAGYAPLPYKHFLLDQYSGQQDNHILKLINTELFEILIAPRPLFDLVQEILSQDPQWSFHYIDYPIYGDCINHKKKIVIQIEDNERMLGGTNQIHNYFTWKSERLFKMKGYQVIYVNQKIYHPVRQFMKDRLAKALCQ